MTPIRVEAPSVEPVSLAEMRAYLRLDPDDGGAEDGLVMALVGAARIALEQETRRILVPGRFRLTLAEWPAGAVLPLPLSPVTALLRAGRAGPNGTVAELAPGLVQLRGDGLEVASLRIDPALDPTGAPLVIDLAAGFGGDGPALPAPLGLAIRRLAASWFEHRGDEPGGGLGGGLDGGRARGLPADVAALAAPFRRLLL
ncbi:head-tail connector protein [Methylobacterium planeticum]|uniref:Phage gp6-like head-tail connector protein n=1 Tax=Methylobacterium planeticum TaxID=2615211 RepID=A0A6N6MNG4_9HYPH|nr:hypothetical protein [Methylobacterium planeticum]KAB1072823.1 hypothetical protein F6X51_14575 [Methylobacterium planeticum]